MVKIPNYVLFLIAATTLGTFAVFSYPSGVAQAISSESRVLSTMMTLTNLAKGQLVNTQHIMDDIKLDLEIKKKFWQLELPLAENAFIFVLAVDVCNLNESQQCAFNVESVQINRDTCQFIFGDCSVQGIIVDESATDIEEKQIATSTNLLIDSGIGIIGASDFVAIVLDDEITGSVQWTGEKPQGLELFQFVIGSPCDPDDPMEVLKQCVKDEVESRRNGV